MTDYEKFPEYYRRYSWYGKHKLFGYPPDTFPQFRWIASLEERFAWVVDNIPDNKSASKYLLQEMIEWGGSQNGVLQKFNDASGEVNLYEIMGCIIDGLSDPKEAISCALQLPGLGLTYASKLLRFMRPEVYGALDSRIRKALYQEGKLPKIFDGNVKSMVSGYMLFVKLIHMIRDELESNGIKNPHPVFQKKGHGVPRTLKWPCFLGQRKEKSSRRMPQV